MILSTYATRQIIVGVIEQKGSENSDHQCHHDATICSRELWPMACVHVQSLSHV